MATFFGHAPLPASTQPPPADQPIKMQGFPLPPLPGAPTPHSSSSASSSLPPASQALGAFAHLYPHLAPQPHLLHQHLGQPPAPGQGPGIDPSILLGFTDHHHHHHDLSGAGHYGSLGNGGFGAPHPGTSVLSDADLDFESVLASLGAAAHQQQQQQQQRAHVRAVYGSHEVHTDIFAAGGMFDQAAMHPPPLNGQQQQLSPRLQLDRMPSYFTQHAAPQQQQPQQPPPPESFPSPALPSSASAVAAAAKPVERGRGTSSKRSASTERTGRTGRSATAGTSSSAGGGGSVGKAPRQSRSRSARRSSSAAGYDRDRPSPTSRESGGRRGAAAAASAAAGGPGGAGAGEEGADPSPAATPGSGGAPNGAIGIPTASASASGEHAHQYAMSLPAYPSASLSGTPSSVPGGAGSGAWGALAAAHPHAFPAHAFNGASPGGGGGGGQQQQADPASGWRPSPPPGAAASAPPATGLAGRSPTAGGGVKAPGKKGKGLADVQEEDDGKGDPLSEKRRKRRESHNAVERRRRDNINDRIAELSLLVPDTFLVPGSPPPDGSASGAGMLPPVDEGPASPAIGALSLMSPGPSSAAVLGGSPASAPGAGFATRAQQQAAAASEKLSAQQLAAKEKPNKGVVLAKSVEYIKYLQQMVELSQQHAVELQRENAALRDALVSSSLQQRQHGHLPASTSFPNSTAASSSFSAPATNPTGSPASPHAYSNGTATGASALGLALESPNSNSGGGGVRSGSFFDFGPSSEHEQQGGDDEREGAGAEGERDEEERGRPAAGGGRSARAGERAWTPMLEGLDMEGLAALKEEDMDQS